MRAAPSMRQASTSHIFGHKSLYYRPLLAYRSRGAPVRSSATPPQQPVAPDDDDVVAEAVARQGWDPAGLLPPLTKLDGIDHFARRARARQQQAGSGSAAASTSTAAAVAPTAEAALVAAAAAAPPPSVPAPAAPDGLKREPASTTARPIRLLTLAAEQTQAQVLGVRADGADAAGAAAGYDTGAFSALLAERHMPLDLTVPSLRVLSLDPPVLLFEGFASSQECAAWRTAALDSGMLAQSKIGAGNAGQAVGHGAVVYGQRRTSSSLLLDGTAQTASPALAALVRELQRRALLLLAPLDNGRSWGTPGRLPSGGQYCFEHPQVARYEAGQHFLAHEDAFPPELAAGNGFQRHATLLLYLNDVQQGGETHFEHLGLSVRPREGSALVFFPASADGRADERTLHTARDAVDTKWVVQQWVARGHPVPAAAHAAVQRAVAAAAHRGAADAATRAAAVESAQAPVREVLRVAASSGSQQQQGGGKRKSGKKGGGSSSSKKGFGQ